MTNFRTVAPVHWSQGLEHAGWSKSLAMFQGLCGAVRSQGLTLLLDK